MIDDKDNLSPEVVAQLEELRDNLRVRLELVQKEIASLHVKARRFMEEVMMVRAALGEYDQD